MTAHFSPFISNTTWMTGTMPRRHSYDIHHSEDHPYVFTMRIIAHPVIHFFTWRIPATLKFSATAKVTISTASVHFRELGLNDSECEILRKHFFSIHKFYGLAGILYGAIHLFIHCITRIVIAFFCVCVCFYLIPFTKALMCNINSRY